MHDAVGSWTRVESQEARSTVLQVRPLSPHSREISVMIITLRKVEVELEFLYLNIFLLNVLSVFTIFCKFFECYFGRSI